jgi:hypothetical protein
MITGWKYYMPDDGETAADAKDIILHPDLYTESIFDASDAARLAADDYYVRNSSEIDIGSGITFAIINPKGDETKFSIEYEMTVTHHIEQIEEEGE